MPRGAGPVPVGLIAGALAGALGLRPQKVVLGPLVGLAVGFAFSAWWGVAPAAIVAGVTVLAFRSLSAAVFRDPQVRWPTRYSWE